MKKCISIAILAGGEGQRFGGIFKPLLNICNEPMIKIMTRKIEGIGCEVIVSVKNRDQINILRKVMEYNVRYVIDREIHTIGILRALYSISQEVNYDTILILPCDTPFINRETITNLLISHRDECDVTIPIWPNGYIEPLIGIYDKHSLSKALEYALKNNATSVRDIYRYMHNVCYIDIHTISANPDKEFLNINTYEDIAVAQILCQELGKQ